MRQSNPELEKWRVRKGYFASDASAGMNGAFDITGPNGKLIVIASDGSLAPWEHVLVRHFKRIPTWEEMCFVKELFWDDEEWVVQYHPAKSEYVNNHPHVLHLWRPTEVEIPTPPSILVGIKNDRR